MAHPESGSVSAGATGQWRVREARPSDLPQLARIEVRSYTTPWSPEGFAALGANDSVRILVAEGAPQTGGSALSGYAVYWVVGDEAELANIAVDPSKRARGLGGVLLDEVIRVASAEGAATIYLDVRVSNRAAIALYRGRGFRPIATRPQYYEHPSEDATVMRLDLRSTDP